MSTHLFYFPKGKRLESGTGGHLDKVSVCSYRRFCDNKGGKTVNMLAPTANNVLVDLDRYDEVDCEECRAGQAKRTLKQMGCAHLRVDLFSYDQPRCVDCGLPIKVQP